MKFKKTIITGLLVVSALSIFSTPVFAKNEEYRFLLSNTGQDYNVYSYNSNEKLYVNDRATVKATFVNAPGWGMAFIMMHRYYDPMGNVSYERDTISRPAFWLSEETTIHPKYLTGHAFAHRKYHVAARIDDDYYGTYHCRGLYNSDYTNP